MPDCICPECAAGKHRNCDGTAWCDVLDEPVRCTCSPTHHSSGYPPLR